jgi:polysaccharide export outer membrane protein
VAQAGGTDAVPGKARPLLALHPTTAEPSLASQPGCTRCQAATMLLPVAGELNGTDASDWAPVQRVSATGGGDGGVRNADGMGPALANPLVPGGPEALAMPRANSPVTAAPPPAAAMLPSPRPVAGNGPAQPPAGSGYPDLPAPVVTHPVDAPREFAKRAVSAYIVEPPDVLALDSTDDIGDPKMPIRGPHLVRPDGTIGLGTFGSVFVAGMTLEQAKQQIAQVVLSAQAKGKKTQTLQQIMQGIKVDVAAFNSKFYYVITDGGGYGEQVVRVPFTGNETVLDAVAVIQGLPNVAAKKLMWVARATEDQSHPYVLPVDWNAIARCGSAGTNYQLYPGDRVYVNSDPFIRLDSRLAKFFAPIQRTLGITLLGASVVNSIKNGTTNGTGTSGLVR